MPGPDVRASYARRTRHFTRLAAGRIVIYQYTPEILDQLAIHGIRPRSDTDPAFIREYLSDLYRYEIRRLKARLLQKEFPRAEYAGLVRGLRRKYVLLSTSPGRWVTNATDRGLQ